MVYYTALPTTAVSRLSVYCSSSGRLLLSFVIDQFQVVEMYKKNFPLVIFFLKKRTNERISKPSEHNIHPIKQRGKDSGRLSER